jgi:hypothetical protein
MFLFKNHKEIINSIITSISLSQEGGSKVSWNVVIPPCFHGGVFAQDLKTGIKGKVQNSRVALISADGIQSPHDLIRKMTHEWNLNDGVKIEESDPPDILLGKLLDSTGNDVNILIFREFRKIITKMDEEMLVALRDAEQAGRMHTAAISIYPLKWIKENWKDAGKLLTMSNYGDAHSLLEVENLDSKAVVQITKGMDISDNLAKRLYHMTGGYPEVLQAVFETWVCDDRPNFTFDVQKKLADVAERAVEPLCKHIDRGEKDRFSPLILNLHYHRDGYNALRVIERFHPWASVLLEGDELRTDSVGEVLAKLKIEAAFSSGKELEQCDGAYQLITEDYKREQYDLVLASIQEAMVLFPSPYLELIECHASIMQGLRDGVPGSEFPDIDTEWFKINNWIKEGRKLIRTVFTNNNDIQTIYSERYDELENFGKKIIKSGKNNSSRILDSIGGLQSDEADPKVAFSLLLFQYESAKTLRGNSTACKQIIELPEQMIRLWGYWNCKANYYKVPDFTKSEWNSILEIFPSNFDSPKRPARGRQFPNMLLFLCFLYVKQTKGECDSIWESPGEFHSERAFFEKRNDAVHATIVFSTKERDKIFSYSDKWLDRVETYCEQELGFKKIDAKALIKPLPIPKFGKLGSNDSSN